MSARSAKTRQQRDGYLDGQLLIAMPAMGDPRFARSVMGRGSANVLRRIVKAVYYRAQTKPKTPGRSDDDQAGLALLDGHYRPYNERLAAEQGLNLAAWAPAAPPA